MDATVLDSAGERARKRDRILNAAMELFLENGYAQTKMVEVAARADLAKSSLYEYFTSKESLFVEFIETKVLADYRSFLEKSSGCAGFEARIRHFVRFETERVVSLLKGHDLFPKIFMEMEFVSAPAIKAAIRSVLEFKFRVLQRWIEGGMDTGEFRRSDPFTATACFIGAFNFYILCRCHAEHRDAPPSLCPPSEPDIEKFFQTVFLGLLNTQGDCPP